MNIAALLNYGPRLKATDEIVSKRSGEKNGKRYSPKMIERYKAKSQNGMVSSTLLSKSENTQVHTIAQNLRAMALDGILIDAGRCKDSKSSNKPILYRWKE